MGTGRNKGIQSGDSAVPGKVAVDLRGRNVWQWNDDQLDNTAIMLQRLENPELALEPTRKARRLKADAAGNVRQPSARERSPSKSADESVTLNIEQTFSVKVGGGFDPYNSS